MIDSPSLAQSHTLVVGDLPGLLLAPFSNCCTTLVRNRKDRVHSIDMSSIVKYRPVRVSAGLFLHGIPRQGAGKLIGSIRNTVAMKMLCCAEAGKCVARMI
jgi:hypothetical protein